MFQVVNRCFQIMQTRTEDSWRRESDLVITPDVSRIEWDGFGCGPGDAEGRRSGRAGRAAGDPQLAPGAADGAGTDV